MMAVNRAAYLRPGTIEGWTTSDLREWARRAVAAGIDTAVTKTAALSSGAVAELRNQGLHVVGSFTVFAEQQGRTSPVHLLPVDEYGRVVKKVERYRGIVPGSRTFLAQRCVDLADELTRVAVEGVVLDFVRWPGRWEMDERPGARLIRTSYDPLTLARFNHWLRSRHQAAAILPEMSAAAAIDAAYADHWTRFRCDTVTTAITALVKVVHAAGLWAGAFIVPASAPRRAAVYGQDVAVLAGVVDCLWTMAYQAIAHQDAEWPMRVACEVSAATSAPVVAMVQTSADRRLSGGADWGLDLSATDVCAALRALERARTTGIIAGTCLFPGEVLPPGQAGPTDTNNPLNGAHP